MSFDFPKSFNFRMSVYTMLNQQYGGDLNGETIERMLNNMSHDAFLLELDHVFHDYHQEVFRTMDRFDDRINDLEKGLHHG